jgi:hypothetical protein
MSSVSSFLEIFLRISEIGRQGIKNCNSMYFLCDFQKWINAFTEHAAFSTHYLTQGHVQFDDSDDEDHHIKPLGSMQVTASGNYVTQLLTLKDYLK